MKKFWRFINRHTTILFILTIFVFAIIYSLLSVLRHMHFQSGAFDLGIYDQALWQYSHFQYPFSTIKEKIVLGDHLNLILPLLSPLYWIWDDVRGLLIFQATWVSFSAIGIYLYLQKRTFTKFQSALLSYVYLLFYGVQFGIFFDFHPILLAVGLLAWILYFWEAGKWKLFWVSIFALFLIQENTGVALLGLCCIWFFQKKHLGKVFLLALIGVIATVLSFYVIHLLSQGHLQYVPHFASTVPGVIESFYDVQEKRDVWIYSFISFGFLPIFSIGSVLAVVGDLSQYFITGSAFDHMWSPFLHHRAILAIFLIAGTSDVLLFIKSKKAIVITPLVILLFLWSVFITYHYHFAITKLAHKDYWHNEQWMKDNEEIIKKIPPQASLATQQSLVPHVDHRNKIYLVYPRQHVIKNLSECSKSCWWLDFDGKPKYLFVDTHPGEWLTMTLESIDNFNLAISNMEKSGAITLISKQSEARLYKINSNILRNLAL